MVRCPTIENHTDIRGDQLRRLIQKAISNTEDPFVWPPRLVRVAYSDSEYFHGHALCEFGLIEVWVRNDYSGTELEMLSLAQLLAHEFDHLSNRDHASEGGDMPAWWLTPVPWAIGMKVKLRKGGH